MNKANHGVGLVHFDDVDPLLELIDLVGIAEEVGYRFHLGVVAFAHSGSSVVFGNRLTLATYQ